ncbi:PTS transporter subunit EIIB [Mycoplasma tauri]|uniref:PTS transporter subunit EIIB n=4 Tax=Mycoplasma tauri TaxID=547987 RepID=A0A953NEM6_9MOLU|nr:PTS transporter subunit EIIB [Mycoplasma tauri]MBZ4195543.1 PTS transporter subunit EIIB [Mycoplasma tauri]MBZ4212456.1 PTS transporter subunit EIIB [Mycoplasma tauri]MBZ4218117.1 PTS transporter subunit EIIB [Mycoplasma tauri]MBZ4226930.1 PTS transporter subunit EIIB [Mycoplasma tauri]QSB07794.1 PTS transporter subunit EIIB [Mycoplasma tauri]
MTKKDKFIIVILTIFTIGFCWLYWKLKAKKIQKNKRGEINKLDSSVDIEQLINFLGTRKNIISVDNSISSLKVKFKEKELINVEALKKLKYISGVMLSTNKISLIVGSYAKLISIKLNDFLK